MSILRLSVRVKIHEGLILEHTSTCECTLIFIYPYDDFYCFLAVLYLNFYCNDIVQTEMAHFVSFKNFHIL